LRKKKIDHRSFFSILEPPWIKVVWMWMWAVTCFSVGEVEEKMRILQAFYMKKLVDVD